jgi:hypothetical protein
MHLLSCWCNPDDVQAQSVTHHPSHALLDFTTATLEGASSQVSDCIAERTVSHKETDTDPENTKIVVNTGSQGCQQEVVCSIDVDNRLDSLAQGRAKGHNCSWANRKQVQRLCSEGGWRQSTDVLHGISI